MIEIKHRLTGAVLYSSALSTLYAAIEAAVKDGAYLRGANLADADLRDADLRDANLRGADLSYATLPEGVPIVEDIDQKILAAISAGGTLDMSAWHTCETTHCRAGWAIALAGAAGHKLEKSFGPQVAGALIYARSRPGRALPDFFANDKDAIASIQKDAA